MPLESFYKNIFRWLVLLNIAGLPAILFTLSEFMAYVTVLCMLMLAGVTLYYSIRLYHVIPGIVPLLALCGGIVLAVGGSIADMVATVLCSPDLSKEGNPIILTLLSNNCSIWFIYLVTLFYQILKVSITLYLWASFLKIYPSMVKSIPYVNFFTTLKWLMGAGKMSFSEFLLNKNIQLEFLMPSLSFIMLMFYFFRWYFAMEWLELVPFISETAILAFCSFFASLFILGFFTHLKKRAQIKQ